MVNVLIALALIILIVIGVWAVLDIKAIEREAEEDEAMDLFILKTFLEMSKRIAVLEVRLDEIKSEDK